MLTLLRRHSRSIIIKLIYVALILSFLVWGIGSYKSKKDLIAVNVNGQPITFDEYRRALDNLTNYYRETLKDKFNEDVLVKLNLRKRALDSLIDRLLVLQEAEKQNIKITEEELQRRIESFPAFQENGKFNRDKYFQLLNYNKINPSDFEAEQRGLIRMERVAEIVKSSASVSDEETLEEYKKEKTTVNLEFVLVKPEDYEKSVTPTKKDMTDYFSSHMGDFTIPEKIKLGYVVLDPKDFVKDINLSREDFEDYYKNYIDDFTTPKKVKARHILIKFNDDKEKARKKAEEILERIKNGEDFSTLAGKYSEDAGSAEKGGDLGFFERGTMVKPFEDAAFSLEKGEVGDPVESRFGFHIIEVLDIAEERVKPIEEVRSEIRSILEDELSVELVGAKAEDLYYESLKGKGLEEPAKEAKLPYQKTGLFVLDKIPGDLKKFSSSVHAASTMEPGWTSRPIEVDKMQYIITLLEKEPPREPAFDEVENKVKKAVTKELAVAAARETGEKILKELTGGKPFEKVLKKYKLKTQETGPFSRVRNFVPKIGVSEEIVKKAFELDKSHPVADEIFKVANNTVIIRLKDRKEIDMDLFAGEKESFKAGLLERKKEEVYGNWLDETRRKAKIEFHEDLIDAEG